MAQVTELIRSAWWVVYRTTGAYALDQKINERRARQDETLASELEAAGLHDSAASMRELAGWRREW